MGVVDRSIRFGAANKTSLCTVQPHHIAFDGFVEAGEAHVCNDLSQFTNVLKIDVSFSPLPSDNFKVYKDFYLTAKAGI